MNKDRLILAVGVGSLLLGAAFIGNVILSVFPPPQFTIGREWIDVLLSISIALLLLLMLCLITLPGGLAIYHGFTLLKRSTHSGIKGAMGAAAVMGTMAIWSGLLRVINASPDEIDLAYSSPLLMMTSLVMLWVYIVTSRLLIARAGLGHARSGDLVGKGTALFFAWLLWFTSDSLIESLVPIRASEGPGWMALLHIVAIVVAWWFYIFTASFIEYHKSPDPTEPEIRAQTGGST